TLRSNPSISTPYAYQAFFRSNANQVREDITMNDVPGAFAKEVLRHQAIRRHHAGKVEVRHLQVSQRSVPDSELRQRALKIAAQVPRPQSQRRGRRPTLRRNGRTVGIHVSEDAVLVNRGRLGHGVDHPDNLDPLPGHERLLKITPHADSPLGIEHIEAGPLRSGGRRPAVEGVLTIHAKRPFVSPADTLT